MSWIAGSGDAHAIFWASPCHQRVLAKGSVETLEAQSSLRALFDGGGDSLAKLAAKNGFGSVPKSALVAIVEDIGCEVSGPDFLFDVVWGPAKHHFQMMEGAKVLEIVKQRSN